MWYRFGILAFALLFVGADQKPQDSLQKTLLASETQLIDAIKQKDRQSLQEMLSEQVYSITSDDGKETGIQTLKKLDSVTIDDYEISEVKAIPLGKDAAILTYTFTWSGHAAGKKIPSTTVFATSTWRRSDGKWKSILYQETPFHVSPK